MSQKISELAQANIHLRNEKTKYNNQKNRALKFEKLYKAEKQKNISLTEENKKLKEDLERVIQANEEYAKIIFRKTSKSNTEKQEAHKSIFKEAKNKKRTKESYKKKLPNKKDITFSKEYNITNCKYCNNSLSDIKKYKRYIEDINNSFVAKESIKTIREEIIKS
jgi:excinuclease UvrABC ATPase subunit